MLLSWFLTLTVFILLAGFGTFLLWGVIKNSFSDVGTRYVLIISYFAIVAIFCFLILQPAFYDMVSIDEEDEEVNQERTDMP